MNVAILSAGGSSTEAGNIGVGFAVPSNLAERIANEIIENGAATHGLLGATVTSAEADGQSDIVGALISEVSSGGAAEQAGLQAGDVVTEFNGVPITDQTDLTAQVRALAGRREGRRHVHPRRRVADGDRHARHLRGLTPSPEVTTAGPDRSRSGPAAVVRPPASHVPTARLDRLPSE